MEPTPPRISTPEFAALLRSAQESCSTVEQPPPFLTSKSNLRHAAPVEDRRPLFATAHRGVPNIPFSNSAATRLVKPVSFFIRRRIGGRWCFLWSVVVRRNKRIRGKVVYMRKQSLHEPNTNKTRFIPLRPQQLVVAHRIENSKYRRLFCLYIETRPRPLMDIFGCDIFSLHHRKAFFQDYEAPRQIVMQICHPGATDNKVYSGQDRNKNRRKHGKPLKLCLLQHTIYNSRTKNNAHGVFNVPKAFKERPAAIMVSNRPSHIKQQTMSFCGEVRHISLFFLWRRSRDRVADLHRPTVLILTPNTITFLRRSSNRLVIPRWPRHPHLNRRFIIGFLVPTSHIALTMPIQKTRHSSTPERKSRDQAKGMGQ